MKRAVSISIGSSSRDKKVEINLLGETVSLERIGTDGDMEKAAQLYGELDGKVDAFGVGGALLGWAAAGVTSPGLFAAAATLVLVTATVFGLPPLVMMQTDFAVYVGIVYSYLPFFILPLYTNLVKLDPALLEASADLGARQASRHTAVAGIELSFPGTDAPESGRTRDKIKAADKNKNWRVFRETS